MSNNCKNFLLFDYGGYFFTTPQKIAPVILFTGAIFELLGANRPSPPRILSAVQQTVFAQSEKYMYSVYIARAEKFSPPFATIIMLIAL